MTMSGIQDNGSYNIHPSFYEGHNMALVTFATRVCQVLGVQTVVGRCLDSISGAILSNSSLAVTNAAGGLNPAYSVGDIVVLNDVSNKPSLAPPCLRLKGVTPLA